MSRLTITLSDSRYRALKQAAVEREKTIGALIDESLAFYGIKTREEARALVDRARSASAIGSKAAMELALKEVAVVRRKR